MREACVGCRSLEKPAVDVVRPEADERSGEHRGAHEQAQTSGRDGDRPREQEHSGGHEEPRSQHGEGEPRSAESHEPVAHRAAQRDAEAQRVAPHVRVEDPVIDDLPAVTKRRKRQHPAPQQERQRNPLRTTRATHQPRHAPQRQAPEPDADEQRARINRLPLQRIPPQRPPAQQQVDGQREQRRRKGERRRPPGRQGKEGRQVKARTARGTGGRSRT